LSYSNCKNYLKSI